MAVRPDRLTSAILHRMRRRRSWPWLLATILISATLAVPFSKVAAPYYLRWRSMRELTSADPMRRARAVAYVRFHGPKDSSIITDAIATLQSADDAAFVELQVALDDLGFWEHPRVPAGQYLRWVTLVASQPQKSARVFAAELLADLPALAHEPATLQIFDRLLKDPDADVRYPALVFAAELAGSAKDPSKLGKLIVRATEDASPVIAQQAWIYLGLLRPGSWSEPAGLTAQWRGKPAKVACAMLWACLRTQPTAPGPAIEALQDETVDPSVRAMAAYVLGMSHEVQARDALLNLLSTAPQKVTAENQKVYWRAILALPVNPSDAADPGVAALVNLLSQCKAADVQEPNPVLQPLILASLHRHPPALLDARLLNKSDLPMAADHPLVELAMLEGTPAGSRGVSRAANATPLLQAIATRAARQPDPEMLRPALSSDDPALRDLACVIAAERLSRDQQTALAKSLLISFSDEARMSGAVLAGLTGVQPQAVHTLSVDGRKEVDALKHLHSYASFPLNVVTKAALWVQGRLPDADARQMPLDMKVFLGRTDVPVPTLLTLLMEKRLGDALELLLNPRGVERQPLVELLDEKRWWYVLRRRLPAEAPEFWVWADADLAHFQSQVLREWALLQRGRLSPANAHAPANDAASAVVQPMNRDTIDGR